MREMPSFIHAVVGQARARWSSLTPWVVGVVLATLGVLNAGIQVAHAAADAAPQANAHGYDRHVGQRQTSSDLCALDIKGAPARSGVPTSQDALDPRWGDLSMAPAAAWRFVVTDYDDCAKLRLARNASARQSGTAGGTSGTLLSSVEDAVATKAGVRVADDAFEHGYKYHPRIRQRAVQDPKAHNFPYSFDDVILREKPITQADGSLLYRKAGEINGRDGIYEIALNPDTGTIFHRTWRER